MPRSPVRNSHPDYHVRITYGCNGRRLECDGGRYKIRRERVEKAKALRCGLRVFVIGFGTAMPLPSEHLNWMAFYGRGHPNSANAGILSV